MKKTLYILFVFSAYLFVLFFYLCFAFYYFSPVTVSVIIDKNLLDNAPASVNPRQEIDHYLKFASDYFMKNFTIMVEIWNVSVLPLEKNHTFEYKDFRPHHERLAIVFQYGGGWDYGVSKVGAGQINMPITFHDYSNELHKWILVHEMCHQYNAIDLINDQSVMNGYPYMEVSNVVEDGTTVRRERLKDMKSLPPLELDVRSREIINISKRYYALGMDGVEKYFNYSWKRIVYLYETMIQEARHQSDENFRIANCYYMNNDSEKALKYALTAVQKNGNEDGFMPSNFMGNIPLEEKHVLLGNIYFMLKKRDMAIASIEKSLSINNTNFGLLKLLSGLYLEELPSEDWSGEMIQKVIKTNERMIELDPKNVYPYQVLSMVYLGQDNKEKLEEYIRKLLSMNPTLIKIIKKNGYVSLKIVDVTDTAHLEKDVQPGGMTKNISLLYEGLR